MERGAERFYTALLDQVTEGKLKKPLATLARAEEGHARILYLHWAALEKDVAPFDEIYCKLTGDLVEGNQDIEALLHFFKTNMERPCLTAMEMALQIECMAYDIVTLPTILGTSHWQQFFSILPNQKKAISK